MVFDFLSMNQIYLYQEPIDMRKSIDGLSALVTTEMSLDPLTKDLFLFHNKSRDKLKALLWDRNGFWLFYKRLLKQKFVWPDWFIEPVLNLTAEQASQLLQGFNLNGLRPHQELKVVLNF